MIDVEGAVVVAEARDEGSDEGLLLAFAQTGDVPALERLVARLHGPAYRAARRILSDPGAAEDAVSDALVALVGAAPRYAPGSFRAWWSAVLVSRIRNVARSRRRRARAESSARAIGVAGSVAAGADPALALSREEVLARVAELPEDLREALVLHYWSGLSHREVGEAVGCPTGTASSRIRRGLDALRASLASAGAASSFEGAFVLVARSDTARGAPPPSASALVARARSLRPVARSLALAATGGVALVVAAVALALPASAPPVSRPVAATSAGEGAPSVAAFESTEATGAAPSGSAVVPAGDAPRADAPPPAAVAPEDDGEAPLAPAGPLRVVVRDAAGQPVPGASVLLFHSFEEATPVDLQLEGRRYQVAFGRSCRGIFASATTGPDGAASFAGESLPGPTLGVLAWRGDEAGCAAATAPPPGLARELAIVARAPARPGPGRASLRIDLAGRALREGESLHLEIQRGDAFGGTNASLDAERALVLRDIEPGSIRVRIQLERADSTRGVLRILDAELKPGELTVRACDLGGSVVRGRVVLPAGATPADAKVELAPANASFFDGPATVAVGADGTFEAVDVPPGDHVFTARVKGFAAASRAVAVSAGATLPVELVVGAGATVTGRAALRGAVVAGAHVSVSTGVLGRTVLETTTDAGGRFEVRGLAEGAYLVRVEASSGDALVRLAVGAESRDLGAIELEPSRRRTICVRVLGRGGAAAAKASVTACDAEGRVSARADTDADGRARLENLPAESLTVVARTADALSRPVALDAAASEATLALDLVPGSIAGTLAATGPLPARASVRISAADEENRGAGVEPVPAGSGAFEVRGLLPGRYVLEVDGAAARTEVVVAAGAVVRAELDLGDATRELSVAVEGGPSGAIEVVASRPGEERGASAIGVDRRAKLCFVPPGALSVRVRHASAKGVVTWETRIEPSGPTVGLRWPASGTVTGRVRDGEVVVLLGSPGGACLLPDRTGSCTLDGIPAGTYSVEVGPPGARRERGTVAVKPGETMRLEDEEK